jgi:prevent-host-death family protein
MTKPEPITMNVAEAKAKLSELLDAAIAGQRVVIARAGTPLVELTPVQPLPSRKLGFMPELSIPDEFFDPLSDEEIALWEGE